jgi:molecular chaperone GrpE
VKPDDVNERLNGSTAKGSTPDEETMPHDDAAMTHEEQALGDVADELAAQSQQDRLADELTEAQGRVLRAQAELDNFRKRSRREIEDSKRYATIALIRDLLPVIDNLDRALAAAEKDEAADGLLEGVRMVATQLQTVLTQHNCSVIEAEGQPFDPMLHEAIQEMPNDEIPSGHVAMVHQVGYRLHDRVVRPAQVIVSKGPAE